MRTLCVIVGAVVMVFSGICLIHFQGPIKEAGMKQFPEVSNWLTDLTSQGEQFSVSSSYSVEPRSLLD